MSVEYDLFFLFEKKKRPCASVFYETLRGMGFCCLRAVKIDKEYSIEWRDIAPCDSEDGAQEFESLLNLGGREDLRFQFKVGEGLIEFESLRFNETDIYVIHLGTNGLFHLLETLGKRRISIFEFIGTIHMAIGAARGLLVIDTPETEVLALADKNVVDFSLITATMCWGFGQTIIHELKLENASNISIDGLVIHYTSDFE